MIYEQDPRIPCCLIYGLAIKRLIRRNKKVKNKELRLSRYNSRGSEPDVFCNLFLTYSIFTQANKFDHVYIKFDELDFAYNYHGYLIFFFLYVGLYYSNRKLLYLRILT